MDVVRIPDLAAGLAVLGLGVWVLALDWRKWLHQSFALLMLAVGAHFVGLGLTESTGDSGAMLAMAGLLATPFLALDFAVVFQHAYQAATPSGRSRPRLFVRGLLILGAGFAVAAFLLVPALYYDEHGPFGLADHVRTLVLAGLAALVGHQALRAEPGPRRDALLLFAVGFALHPAFFAMQRLGVTLSQPDAMTGYNLAGFILAVAGVLAFLALCVALAYVTRHGDRHTRRVALAILALVGLAASSAWAIELLPPSLYRPYFIALGAAWELAFACAAAYSVLRYCLFSLDARFTRIVREGATAAAIGFAFFLAESTLQDVLKDSLPPTSWGGAVPAIGAGAIAALALWPVHRACARLATRVGPGGDVSRRGREIYRAAYLAARQDGVVTDRERRVLSRLAQELRLATADIQSIESHGLRPKAAPGASGSAA